MNIYVGNLSHGTSEDMLKDLFGQHGDVASVKLIKDRVTNEPRGFGFVTMNNDEQAQAAITALNGFTFEGNRLRVNEAHSQDGSRPGGERRSFGGPRREGGPRSGGFGSDRRSSTGGFGDRPSWGGPRNKF